MEGPGGYPASRLRLALAFVLLLASVYATEKCRTGCQGNAQTFKYAEGTTYKYNLESNVDISLSSAEGQQSATRLRATVLLSQLPQCNQLLRLQNVQVIDSEGKKHGNLADIEKPIRINFHDGHVEDSICAEPGDSQNSLNIKRAVASLFQAALKQNHETDVFGVCPTDISSRKEGANLVVTKRRSLNKCAHRENIKQDFLATAFNLNSEIKSSPLLYAEYDAEQRVKNGILDHAVVNENYLYVPFSVGRNGAKAAVSTKIQLTGTSKEATAGKVSEPRSIIFENPHLVTAEQNNVDNILAALKQTKESIDLVVGENTARAFVNLVKILRVSKKDDILAVYRQVRTGAGFKDKEGSKKVFLDALFRAGTGDTVEVGIELLKNKELNEIEQKVIFLGLAFVRHATLASLGAAAALLDYPNLPREAYLGVGTLAGRYCREHSCKNVDAVNNLVEKLLSKLGDGKANNRQDENQIVTVLKALGNVENLNDAAVNKIVAIAQDKKAPNRLRSAALETLLSDYFACKDKVRDSALSILKDIQQDSEVRIRAYQVLAKCPNGKVANALKAILDVEPSYQVGGYIVSHLRNLRASANPDKELAKRQLGQIGLNKRFPIDLRKYSFNGDLSYAVDTLGLASASEVDVVYSQDSFLPRAAGLNLTAQIFGHTFNFLEVGARQENLDRLLEHYLGPLGVLRSASREELVASGKESIGKIVDHVKQRLDKTRGKRDVSKADLESIAKQVQIKTNGLDADLDIDLSVKLFGSELLFLSLNDQTQKYSPDAVVDKLFDALDGGVNKARNFEKSIQSNIIFIDSEFSYPTSSGFPLRLSVEGSASIQLKAQGKIDIRALLKRESTPLKLSIIPSANIDLTGSLTVDTQLVESGLKVTSSLYTATGGVLELTPVENGKGFDLNFGVPVEEQKLISATHDIVFNTRELGKPETNKPIKFGQNKDFSICLDQLSPFIGLSFCADINQPPVTSKHGLSLPFPLSGNAKFSVGITREDLSHYHIRDVYYSEPNKLGVELVLETVGQNKNKKLSLAIQAFLAPEVYLKADLASAIKSASAEARLINTAQEKALALRLQHDDQKYQGKIGASVSGTPSRSVYKPLLEYGGPGLDGKPSVTVEGSIIVERGDKTLKYTFDNVRITAPNAQRPITVQGSVGQESGALFSDLTVSDGQNSGSLNGRLQVQANQIKLNAEFKNTVNPQINFNLKYDFNRQSPQVDSSLQLIHGADLASKTNKFTLVNSLLAQHKSPQDFELRTSNKLSYPLLAVEGKFDYLLKPKVLKYDLEAQYGQIKLGSRLDAKVSQKLPGDYDVALEVHGLDLKVEAKAKREIAGDRSKIENSIEVNGKKLEVAGTVDHRFKPKDLNVGADLVVRLPERSEPLKVQNGLVLNPNELDTHLKISSGGDVYVDGFLKGTKGGNANGNLKINLKDCVAANGQVRVSNGAGNANVVVELPRVGRKVKAEATFTVAAPKYDLTVALYPDFERDNTKKLLLDTKNQITENSVDSRNVLEVLGKRLEANVKASAEGKLNDGRQNVEVEVTLPNQHYLLYKLDRNARVVNAVVNGNVLLNLEHRENKNTPGAKIVLKGALKDTSLRRDGIVDAEYSLVGENVYGYNLNSDVALKRVLQGDHHVVDGKVKLQTTLLRHPFEATLHSQYKERVGSLKYDVKYGPKASLAVNGRYDLASTDGQIGGDISVALSTPDQKIQNVKLSASGNAARKPEEIKADGALAFTVDDAVNVDVKGDAVITPKTFQFKGAAQLQREPPISVDLGYNTADPKKLNGHVQLQYGDKKNIKADLTLLRPADREYKVDLKLDVPQAPGTKLLVDLKRSDDGKTLTSAVALTVNGKSYAADTELVSSDVSPALVSKLTFPDGKSNLVSVKLNRASPKRLSAELKLKESIWLEKPFEFDGSVEADVESVDDFTIRAGADSPALKLDKVTFEAQNKAPKGGKKIQITVQAAGKNVISGSSTYKAREEGGKYIVEGSGSFKVKEESKQANFKFVRQALSGSKDGEDGQEISFNAGVGNKAVDAELKTTNKQFRLLNSYCEEKKQCAHVEVDSKVINANAGEFNHELEIAVDLRKLGLSHEFGLKGVTSRKNFILDHTVDIYFQNKENKYQYSLFVHPNDAGAQLTTPKRVIAIEGRADVPKQKNAPIRGELTLYLDKKNQPNKKTSLIGVLNCAGDTSKVSNCKSELKLSSPGLNKDLSISYDSKYDAPRKTAEATIVVDVFNDPNQKIVLTSKGHVSAIGSAGITSVAVLEVQSPGLDISYKAEEQLTIDSAKPEFKYSYAIDYNVLGTRSDCKLIVEADSQRARLLVRALGADLLGVNSRIQTGQDNLLVTSDVELIGAKPVVANLVVRNWNSVKYTQALKEKPNDKLQLEASAVPGESAKLSATVLEQGKTVDLAHLLVRLDEANFLKTDAAIDSEAIKNTVGRFKSETKNVAEAVKAFADAKVQGLRDHAQKAIEALKKTSPNLRSLRDYYQTELQRLREEIVSDKTLKEVGEFLRSVLGPLLEALGDFLSTLSGAVERIAAALQQQFAKIIETVNKELIPRVAEVVQSVVKAALGVAEQLVDLALTYVAKLSVFVEAHQAEIKQLTSTVSSIAQDVGRFLYKIAQQAQTVLSKEAGELYEGLKSLPVAEEIKATYKQILGGVDVPEALVRTFKEAVATVRDAVPQPDLKKLVTAVGDYVVKKLKREPVDDVAALQNIVKLAIAALNKLLSGVAAEKDLRLSEKNLSLLPYDLSSLPRLAAVRFSPLTYVLTGGVPSVLQALYGFSLNPRDWIPPYKLDAVVVQGQHIFTFDGKHLTFPGNCNYLLARDAVNGNFTVVGKFTDGLLTAITLADKTDSVTLKKGGQVALNNAATEFPVRKPQLEAFRLYESLHLWSKAGVEVICGPELVVCGIHVSGFYHGQVRGLLGNGNTEPYDDYTLPNGKIVASEGDFGNAYKVGASCPPVKTVDHHVHGHNAACSKLFGADSPLRYCFPVVDPENYKTACDHGLAAGVKDTERALAAGYVASCRFKNVPVNLPKEYLKCENSDKAFEVGDTFSVKTPGKAADVVLLVDQVKSNEVIYKELVQPLIGQIASELGSKGISDVEFHVIGYGGEYQRYPSHYTVAGKLTFSGRAPNLKFTDAPSAPKISLGCEKVDNFLDIVREIVKEAKLLLGQTLQQRTYTEALKYPFRAQAVKALVAVVGKPCDRGHLLLLQKLRALLYFDKQISLNLVTPFEDFNVKGDGKQTKNVIGFNIANVFTLSDAKKKPDGSPDLHDSLDYKDYCVDFTLRHRGNVFVTDNFVQAKAPAKKQFAQVAAHNIVSQLVNVEQGLDCECQVTSPYSAENVCKVAYTKERTVESKRGGQKG